jgi:short-subunit dehydrogenase
VTGASSGIGEAFADELAVGGTDLILVGRDLTALQTVAARAGSMGVHAEVLRADLATEAGVCCVTSALYGADPPVDLLVNNAALGQWGWFVDLPLDRALEMMRVNNDALVRLTHAAIGPMLASGRGCIVQVSSMASAAPGPQQAVYGATKAFVSSFGQALSWELAGTPITCTTVLPGFTRTKYFERVGLDVDIPEHHWMTPGEVARLSLAAASAGRPLLVPGTRNRVKVAIATPFPSLAFGRLKQSARRGVSSVGQARRHAVAVLSATSMTRRPSHSSITDQ